MTSYGQIEANRRNALKSTGPKAEAGKQVSRYSSLDDRIGRGLCRPDLPDR